MNAVPEPEKHRAEKAGTSCPSIRVMPPEATLRRAPSVRSRNRAKAGPSERRVVLARTSVPDAVPAHPPGLPELAKSRRKMYLPELPRARSRGDAPARKNRFAAFSRRNTGVASLASEDTRRQTRRIPGGRPPRRNALRSASAVLKMVSPLRAGFMHHATFTLMPCSSPFHDKGVEIHHLLPAFHRHLL